MSFKLILFVITTNTMFFFFTEDHEVVVLRPLLFEYMSWQKGCVQLTLFCFILYIYDYNNFVPCLF